MRRPAFTLLLLTLVLSLLCASSASAAPVYDACCPIGFRCCNLAGVCTPPCAPALRTLTYFALGDSIASGHGLNDDNGPCRRSTEAYPWQLARLLKDRYGEVRITQLACSGATAGRPGQAALNKSKYLWLTNQVDEVLRSLDSSPALVSITIGINDTQWLSRGVAEMWADSAAFFKWADDTAAAVQHDVQEQVARLLKQPNVYVVLTIYFNPFNETTHVSLLGLGCYSNLGALQCNQRASYVVGQINSALIRTWTNLGRPARMRVAADIQSAFVGHEAPAPACGRTPPAKDTWIQYPGDPNSNSLPSPVNGDCFHPNRSGANRIARAVFDAYASMAK